MTRRAWSHLGVVAFLVAAIPIGGCGGDSTSPAAPGAMPAGLVGNNPDGSTLKVTAPEPQAPTNFFRFDGLTPDFLFTGAAGLHVPVSLGHELQIMTEGGQPIHTQPLASGQTTYVHSSELEFDTVYMWRVRATYQGQVGPWSDIATFQTTERVHVAIEDLEAFLIEFSQGNPEWMACSAGSGTACFRFVWDAVQSMNPTCDPNSWGLLSKNPGEWQCTRSACGTLGGEGFGEDIVTHGSFSPIILWDVIAGAGAPGAMLGASPIPRGDRRPGNEWACPWR